MTAFTQTPQDSAGVTDAVALKQALGRQDSAGLTDSAVVLKTAQKPAQDSAGLTDSVTVLKFLGATWPTVIAGAQANTVTVTLLDGTVVATWPTVYANASAVVLGVAAAPGDDFYGAVELVGANGAITYPLGAAYSAQAGEPAGGTHTLWLRKWPATAGGAITIVPVTAAATVAIDVWEGDTLSDLQSRLDPITGLAEGTTSLVAAVPPIDVTAATRIRVTTSDAAALANFTWAYEAPAGTLVLQLSSDQLSQTPGVLRASVLGADAGETVRFQVVGATYTQDIVVDSSGVLSAVGVQVVRGLLAGSHVLRAAGLSSGRIGEATFTVLNVALRPTPPVADLPAVAVAQTGVRRFVFQDPMPGGLGQYVFPVNPVSASDPFPPKYVTPEHTTASNGQFILWQGAKRATAWKIAGRSVTRAHYDQLVAFGSMRRRVYIHDHRNRAFLCHIEAVDLTVDPRPNEPFAHQYELRALVYGWVQL